MKKFVFLVYHKDYSTFLSELQDLGLIHVVENKVAEAESGELEVFDAKWKRFAETEKLLSKYVDKKNNQLQNPPDVAAGHNLPDAVEKIIDDKNLLTQQLSVATKERNALLPWGNFEPESIARLTEVGYVMNFFSVAKAMYDPSWEDDYNAILVAEQDSKKYFVTITQQSNVAELINQEPLKMPDVSLEKLNGLLDDLKSKIAEKDEELKQHTADIPSLKAAMYDLASQIRYSKAVAGTEKVGDDKIMLLQGWAPANKEAAITEHLESRNAYFEISDPQPDDNVPILFNNNAFSRLFEPIAKMYMLPKYSEIELTPYFAPFYMIFFGLSLGDVGYGLFLLLVCSIARIWKRGTLPQSVNGLLMLMQVFGVASIFCGLLSGGFFGFSLYDVQLPIFRKLKSIAFLDNNQMFNLSLILGAIQIIFGMIIKIFNRCKQFGFVHSLSTIGWVLLLLSFAFANFFPSVMPMMKTAHLIVMAIAGALIFFFNSPGKNILINFGLGLWESYNMITGLLGDILSYIRLFALGLSGGILAGVFNSLAVGMSPDIPIVGPIVIVLIFVAGHAITIFMNTLGAIVHPMRLTFVEFYKNAEFVGGGKKYDPLRKLNSNNYSQ